MNAGAAAYQAQQLNAGGGALLNAGGGPAHHPGLFNNAGAAAAHQAQPNAGGGDEPFGRFGTSPVRPGTFVVGI